MAKFFSLFPQIPYDLSNKQYKTFTKVTDIFFRLRVIRSVLNNITAYYDYIIKDDDRPEILAEKVYGDAEMHWIILLANDIIDAQYDWPMNGRTFKNYIIDKYGSIENAKTTYHHYEKVIERTESFLGITNESRFVVNEFGYANTRYYADNTDYVNIFVTDIKGTINFNNYIDYTVNTTNNIFTGTILSLNDYEIGSNVANVVISNSSGYFLKEQKLNIAITPTVNSIISFISSPKGTTSNPSVPYFSYNDLPETQGVQVYNMGYSGKNTSDTLVNAGRSITEVVRRDAISNYDYEVQVNEKKRSIKIIKPEYLPQILSEFDTLTKNSKTPYIRRLII